MVVDMADGIAVSQKLKENYDQYYGGESQWRALGAAHKAENIVSLCQMVPHESILEIGCGEGSILQRLSDANFGKALFGAEISSSGVSSVMARNISRLRDCQQFDGSRLPYRDRQFDLAVLSHVIEHAEYPRRLIYEAARVARYIFIEVPLEDTTSLKPDFVFDSVGHINFYSRKTFRRLVQSCGLQVLSQKTTNPSRAMYEFQYGRKSVFKYLTKRAMLALSEPLACALFTYHSSLLCANLNEIK